MVDGYEQNYLGLLAGLAGRDLAENGPGLGFKVEKGGLTIDFLGRSYLITNQGVEPLDGRPVDVNNRSLLIHYALSEGRARPLESFLPLNRLTGPMAGRKELDKRLMVKPLLEFFGNDYDKFSRAAKKLGGEERGLDESGGRVWRFQVLPKIPVKVVFQEADEEFPADLEILFDHTALDFMGFECLAFLSASFSKALIDAARAEEGGC